MCKAFAHLKKKIAKDAGVIYRSTAPAMQLFQDFGSSVGRWLPYGDAAQAAHACLALLEEPLQRTLHRQRRLLDEERRRRRRPAVPDLRRCRRRCVSSPRRHLLALLIKL